MDTQTDGVSVSVRQATLDLLRSLGITTIFGNPGSTELPLFRNWPNDFRYVLGLQEASVVAMADGYAQRTGNAAFVNLHAAAGVGHGLGNLYTAFRNQTPMVITAGQQVRELLPMHPFLFSERAPEFPKPYVKWSCEPARAEDVPLALAQAYQIAMQKPCGPTLVSVPVDDWDRPAKAVRPRRVSHDVAPDPALIANAAAAIDASRRPAFVVGAEIDQDGVFDETVALAEKVGAAVWVAPFNHLTSFPEDHRLFQGFLPAAPEVVGSTLSTYDCVIVLGAPVFTFHVAGQCSLFDSGVPVIQLTRDEMSAARSGVGTSIVGNLRLAVPALLAAVGEATREAPPVKAAVPAPAASNPIKAEYLFHVLAGKVTPDTVIVEEVPSHRPALQDHLPRTRPRSFYTMASGGLGFSLPAAVGIALADPSRRVIALTGDGSAMYSIQAIYTAVQNALPVTFIIVNNGGYGAMRSFSQVLGVSNPPGIELPGLDFVSLAQGMGCPGVRIDKADRIAGAFDKAASQAGPMLIEVVVDAGIPHLYAVADA